MTNFRDVIFEAADEAGLLFKESARSLILKCPECSKPKLYFDKEKGNFICFSGSCGNKGKIGKLLSQMTGITIEEANRRIFKGSADHTTPKMNLIFDEDKEAPEEIILPVAVTPDMLPLNMKESIQGIDYLISRGLVPKYCHQFDIRYNPDTKRIIFPIKDEFGTWIGYQARSIDPNNSIRMLNNQGFKKGKQLMFLNEWPKSNFLIITEGPVDALKFSKVGGFVASMGKDITRDQFKILEDHPSTDIYWALDDDADDLIMDYSKRLMKTPHLIKMIPEARARIKALGKKPDFGECTPDECEAAFKNAENLLGRLLIKFS